MVFARLILSCIPVCRFKRGSLVLWNFTIDLMEVCNSPKIACLCLKIFT